MHPNPNHLSNSHPFPPISQQSSFSRKNKFSKLTKFHKSTPLPLMQRVSVSAQIGDFKTEMEDGGDTLCEQQILMFVKEMQNWGLGKWNNGKEQCRSRSQCVSLNPSDVSAKNQSISAPSAGSYGSRRSRGSSVSARSAGAEAICSLKKRITRGRKSLCNISDAIRENKLIAHGYEHELNCVNVELDNVNYQIKLFQHNVHVATHVLEKVRT